jgi:hypothetical protein
MAQDHAEYVGEAEVDGVSECISTKGCRGQYNGGDRGSPTYQSR